MPAARYWRLSGITTRGGQTLDLSQLELWAGGAKLSATLSCPVTPLSGSLANLSDADLGTAASWTLCPGLVFNFDLGSSLSVDGPRIGSVGLAGFPESVMLEYSADSIAWAPLSTFNRVIYPGDSALTAVPTVGDQDFSNVSLLLHGDGANDSTTLSDDAPAPKIITAVGGAKISTTQSQFGGSSIYFNGTNSALTAPTDATMIFGTGDFTIEFFAWKSANGAQNYDRVLHTSSDVSNTNGFMVELSATRGFCMYRSGWISTPVSVNPNDSTWHHWAISRASGTVRAFKDGVQIGTNSNSTDISNAAQIMIGARTLSGDSYWFNGYLDELRVTKGVARYTANFTPHAAPFPGGNTSFTESAVITQSLIGIGTTTNILPPDFTTTDIAAQIMPGLGVGGTSRITGTVKVTPATPVARKVRLYRELDGHLMAQTWSNASTGEYSFDNIPPGFAYTVLSYDHTELYRAVVADRLLSEPMP